MWLNNKSDKDLAIGKHICGETLSGQWSTSVAHAPKN